MAFFAAMTPATDSTTQNTLREAFDALLEQPPEAREAWLESHVADTDSRERLRQLLAAHSGHGFLDTTAGEHAARLAARDLAPEGLIGSRFGAFRVVRALGQGGMSAVFLGEREDADFRQQAAIKLLRRGLYSELEQRLFQRERRVLAALQHPNIARLIDGGVTASGIPYLVMEFVDGVPITRYAETRNLDVRARVHLFVDVCRAVAEAHRNLIVHRDIKPSNILVATDGTVKLLDFGIAKLIEEDDAATSGTVGVFTPDYAAPEQLRGGAITTATDVYGLGVLLHELLLGLRPGGTPTRRPSSRVNEVSDTTVPRIDRARLRKTLRGDLDNILLKALAEEPQRRYASAGALAFDLDNYLTGRAVIAHPPSRLYRTRKFVQRHRGGVVVTAMFLAAIFAALGLALWQAQVARREAARANTVRDFVVGLFDAARAHLPRDQRPTPEALVEAARRHLATGNFDPLTHADLAQTLGEVELSMARFDRAQALFEEAGRAASASDDARAVRHARVAHAQARQRAGDNAGALAELAALMTAARAAPDADLLRALSVQAAAEMTLGKPNAAIADRREAANAALRLYGKNSDAALAAQFEVGNALTQAQRYPEAITTLQPALASWQTLKVARDDRYVAAMDSLATAHDGVGDLSGAETRFRELLALKQQIYTAPHDAIAATLRDLGAILAREEKFTESESLLGQALAMQRQVFGGDHVEIAKTWDALGNVAVAQRHFAEAQTDYGNAIGMCERAHFADEVCPRARNNLGMAYYRQDQLDAARTQMSKALAERRALFGNDHPTVAYSLSTLANVAVKQRDYKTAADESAEALAVLERAGQGTSREDALIRQGHAQALWLLDRNDEALREIDRTLADWQRVAPADKSHRVTMLVQKAQILRDLKRTDDARRTALDAIAVGAPASELAPQTKALLRELSGKSDAYPDSPPH
ncbi:MAG TPA: serine/threonine-protein kinase [Rudaea sp.]|nr:serine/threonine-protein kinase [Rudaea sp.]